MSVSIFSQTTVNLFIMLIGRTSKKIDVDKLNRETDIINNQNGGL